MRSSKRTRKVFQHIRKYLKNYLLYHTWTEFLLTFSSKFIFFFTNLKLLPRTIKIFEVEITVLSSRIFIFSFYFLSHFFTSINVAPNQIQWKNHLFNPTPNSAILQLIHFHLFQFV